MTMNNGLLEVNALHMHEARSVLKLYHHDIDITVTFGTSV